MRLCFTLILILNRVQNCTTKSIELVVDLMIYLGGIVGFLIFSIVRKVYIKDDRS